MNTTFLAVTVVGTLAVVSPGPDFLIVTRNSLLYSKRVGLATALGIAVGIIWWVAASVLGISYIISKTIALFNVIKWLGALYLVYLGIRSFHSKRGSTSETKTVGLVGRSVVTMTPARAFRTGLLTNLLNPKCALFFVSLFSVVVAPNSSLVLRCAYGLEIMLIAVAWFSLLATVLSVERVKRIFEQVSVWFERVTGAILIALGIRLALYRK